MGSFPAVFAFTMQLNYVAAVVIAGLITKQTVAAAPVTGVIREGETNKVLFEVRPQDPSKDQYTFSILAPGESDGRVHLKSFDPKTGIGEAEIGKRSQTFTWTGTSTPLDFQNMSVLQALYYYAACTGRTLLRPSSLNIMQRISVRSDADPKSADALKSVKDACAAKNIHIESVGEKFLIAVGPNENGLIPLALEKLSSMQNVDQSSGAKVQLKFENAFFGKILDFYSTNSGKTILRASTLPVTQFMSVTSHGAALTPAEALSAIEATIALNHFAIVPAGKRFAFAVRKGDLDRLSRIISSFSNSLREAEVEETKREVQVTWQNLPLHQACEIYANILGRRLAPNQLIPRTFVNLNPPTKVSKNEALLAINAVFMLNGVEVISASETDSGLIVMINGKPVAKHGEAAADP